MADEKVKDETKIETALETTTETVKVVEPVPAAPPEFLAPESLPAPG